MSRARELYEVRSGSRHALVSEQGASLVQVNWDGADLLDSPGDDGFAGQGSYGQLLVPWPGRVTKGRYEYDGQSYQLPVDDHVSGAAIHGLARWAAWQPGEQRPGRLSLRCRLLGVPGYPFPLELEQSYAFAGDELEVVFSARNIGPARAPFGYGCHPYFSVGSPTIDGDELQVGANEHLPAGPDMAPSGPPLPVAGTPSDFRQARPVGAARLDVTLTGLTRDDEGRAAAELRAPDGSARITCRYEPPINYVQLYSGDTLPAKRREGLAIEPYTCAPNAFNNGLGLVHLPPGGLARVRWTISAS